MRIIFDHLHGHVENDRVFCEAFVIPEGESDEELLALGFLPNLQPPLYWYQARSCRINSNLVKLSYKRRKQLSQLDIEIFNYSDIADGADLFFNNYFILKNFDLQRDVKFTSLSLLFQVLASLLSQIVILRWVQTHQSTPVSDTRPSPRRTTSDHRVTILCRLPLPYPDNRVTVL
jgi:hypothetical protein